jgi:hypothetical protein
MTDEIRQMVEKAGVEYFAAVDIREDIPLVEREWIKTGANDFLIAIRASMNLLHTRAVESLHQHRSKVIES